MKRFKNILYFADGVSEPGHALTRALELADANNARLTVVDVIEEHPSDPTLEKRLGYTINQLMQDIRLGEIDAMLAPYQREDRVIYTKVLSGVRFVEVIRTVQRNVYDLLVKEAGPEEGLAERLLGSTDLHLLRKCPCPVWIDRQEKPLPYRNILAAVDPLREQNEARLVMDLATSMAAGSKADLEVFHAWHLKGESILRSGRAQISKMELNLILEKEKEIHTRQFAQLLSSYEMSIDDPGVHLVKAVPTQGILERAEQADLIVMGTVGRTGIPGLFIGNTAENVMQNTEASILAVKPSGFRSPLE